MNPLPLPKSVTRHTGLSSTQGALRRLNVITFQSAWYVTKTSLPNARDSDHIIPVVTMVSVRAGPETNPRSDCWLSASSHTLSPNSSVYPEVPLEPTGKRASPSLNRIRGVARTS